MRCRSIPLAPEGQPEFQRRVHFQIAEVALVTDHRSGFVGTMPRPAHSLAGLIAKP
jgi:hypothetical protein